MNREKFQKPLIDTYQQYHQKLMLELKEMHDLRTHLSADDQADPLFVGRIEQKCRHLENALLRLQDGTYGTCLLCGNEIDTNRLRILPYAELCLECQHKKEMGSL